MNAFVESLTTSGFWLSVVFVSIVLNVVSSYIKAGTDRFFSAISSSWHRRTEESKKRRAALVAHLKADPHTQLVCLSIVNRKHIESVFFFAFGFFVFSLAQFSKLSIAVIPLIDGHAVEFYRTAKPFINGFGVLVFMWALGCRNEAQRIASLVDEANMGAIRI